MRILFWGTPEFAVPSLRALLGEGHEVVGVVTRPDRPRGRGRTLHPSPIKEVAVEDGLPVLVPDVPRGESFVSAIRALQPEISVVVAYGHILRPEILDLPELGSWNLHASLLPELRGAAPVNWAIARGLDRTGITIMRMTEGMDEGPILLQRELPIAEEDSFSSLYLRLAELGAEAVVEALAFLEAGVIELTEQEHDRATYAPKVDRGTARIDWSRPAPELANHIRAMDLVPGAWTLLEGEPLKCFRPQAVPDEGDAVPGTVVRADPREGLTVRAGEGAVVLGEVQAPGKRRMEAGEWLRGASVVPGTRLE